MFKISSDLNFGLGQNGYLEINGSSAGACKADDVSVSGLMSLLLSAETFELQKTWYSDDTVNEIRASS